jgi:putative oxidoreductase
MKRFLVGSSISPDLAALILRVGAGAAMLTHGWPKLYNFADRMNTFSDPFGIGSTASLALAVFAEFFCSVLLIIGFYTRAAVIPLIITMGTIIFRVHWHDGFGKKELPLLYLIAFLAVFFMGSGKYSADGKG